MVEKHPNCNPIAVVERAERLPEIDRALLIAFLPRNAF